MNTSCDWIDPDGLTSSIERFSPITTSIRFTLVAASVPLTGNEWKLRNAVPGAGAEAMLVPNSKTELRPVVLSRRLGSKVNDE